MHASLGMRTPSHCGTVAAPDVATGALTDAPVQVRQCRKGLREFVQSEVDPDTVPFKDRAREKARRADARRAEQAGTGKVAVRAAARVAREAAAREAAKVAEKKKLPAAKRKTLAAREDATDLNDDYRLWRKLKKGKISDAEYLEAMNVDL